MAPRYLCHLWERGFSRQSCTVLRTLVITSDTELVWKVEPTLRMLEFDVDLKPTVADGIDKMRYQGYSALVVDCSAGTPEQLRKSREQWLKRDSTIIAVAARGGSTYDGIPGADTVWTQPLMPWDMYRTLLEVRTREVGDRRLRKRVAPSRPTSLRYSYDGNNFCEAKIADITETGIAVEGVSEMPTGHPLQVEFKLPAMLGAIQSMADVVWQTERRAGLRFVQMDETQRKRLERWLKQSRLGLSTGYSYASGY